MVQPWRSVIFGTANGIQSSLGSIYFCELKFFEWYLSVKQRITNVNVVSDRKINVIEITEISYHSSAINVLLAVLKGDSNVFCIHVYRNPWIIPLKNLKKHFVNTQTTLPTIIKLVVATFIVEFSKNAIVNAKINKIKLMTFINVCQENSCTQM